MDPHRFDDLSFPIYDPLPDPNRSLNFANGFGGNEPALASDSFALSCLLTGQGGALNNKPPFSVKNCCDPSMSSGTSFIAGGESHSSSDDDDISDPILKYINQMLMEEEESVWVSPDDLALQNTEKSLYDALGEQYPDDDPGEYGVQPLETVPCSNLSYNSLSNSTGNTHGLVEFPISVKNTLIDNDSVLQFKMGLEEASKFLPPSSQLVINVDSVSTCNGAERGPLEVSVDENKAGGEGMVRVTRGRKNHQREDDLGLVEGRATKQTASYLEAEESELSDMLDKVLLSAEEVEPPCSSSSGNTREDMQTGTLVCGADGGWGRGRRRGNNSSVNLSALLILCAQAVSSNDLRTANELLNQIRANSSPSGDGSQRLAHYFANGLEARLVGNTGVTRGSFYASLSCERRSVVEILKGYGLHLSCCLLNKLFTSYMNYVILNLSREATVLHVIDFGIGFGFKWPVLIQKLGERPGGPPKLRITGIDLPRSGFRPAERVEEAGRRLAWYCERFNVPFEYNPLPSRNWEDIKIKDLKIRSGETVAVSCCARFEDLLDETIYGDSPRDAVLDLIRRIKPAVFVHGLANGSCNAPFFVTRFREALFYMSSIYDMLDTTVPDEHKDSEERKYLESNFYGRDVVNMIACEGPERAVRPETYKQWQIRHARAGFKQLTLDQDMMKKFRKRIKAWYHKEFELEEDGDWMLLGWKGRIFHAAACWVTI